ncbi:MAG: hypothetical protein ACJ8DJ_04350, partial [Gemmatimonadales bacterium]
RIFAESRYTDLGANRAYFAAQARRILAERKPLAWWLERTVPARDPVGFGRVYAGFYALMGSMARDWR